jgi:hypothetical protein
MADETPKEPWLPIEALGQILVWFVLCAMAAAAILGTLALVKCWRLIAHYDPAGIDAIDTGDCRPEKRVQSAASSQPIPQRLSGAAKQIKLAEFATSAERQPTAIWRNGGPVVITGTRRRHS